MSSKTERPIPRPLLVTLNEVLGARRLPPTKRWRLYVRTLETLDDAAKRFPDHPDLLHRRLNCLSDSLALLEASPTLVKPAVLGPLRLRLAVEALSLVPKRFPKDSPFGAACLKAFVVAHQTFARHAPDREPSWTRALGAFEKAVKKANAAPRSHAEGRLRSAAPINALVTLGRDAPWMKAVAAFAPPSPLA